MSLSCLNSRFLDLVKVKCVVKVRKMDTCKNVSDFNIDQMAVPRRLQNTLDCSRLFDLVGVCHYVYMSN